MGASADQGSTACGSAKPDAVDSAGAAEIRQLAQQVITLAAESGVRIAVAESLTGGALAAALVEVPGASAAFSGAVVAYDTALKASLLGVDVEVLTQHGPVHPDVAKQMARGVRHACAVPRAVVPGVTVPGETVPGETVPRETVRHEVVSPPQPVTGLAAVGARDAEIGVATTGVAGPDADPQTGQPPGTVWIGVSSMRGDRSVSLSLRGGRAEIREAVVCVALRELLNEVRSVG